MRTFLLYFTMFYAIVSTFTMVATVIVFLPIQLVTGKPAGYFRWRIRVHFIPYDFWIGAFLSKKGVLYICLIPTVAIRIWQEERL